MASRGAYVGGLQPGVLHTRSCNPQAYPQPVVHEIPAHPGAPAPPPGLSRLAVDPGCATLVSSSGLPDAGASRCLAVDSSLLALKPTRCAPMVRPGTSLSRGSSVTPDTPAPEPPELAQRRVSSSCGNPHFVSRNPSGLPTRPAAFASPRTGQGGVLSPWHLDCPNPSSAPTPPVAIHGIPGLVLTLAKESPCTQSRRAVSRRAHRDGKLSPCEGPAPVELHRPEGWCDPRPWGLDSHVVGGAAPSQSAHGTDDHRRHRWDQT